MCVTILKNYPTAQTRPKGPLWAPLRNSQWEYLKVMKVCQKVLYQWGPTIQGVLPCFEHSRGVMTCSGSFLPVRVYFRQTGLFWGPSGYPNGPRVGQHDIKSCIIPLGTVLGPLGPFQAVIWLPGQFLPVGMWAGPKISILLLWKNFQEYISPDQYQSVNWS